MLDEAQLEVLFDHLSLSAKARTVVRTIRSSPPSRRVQNRRSNVNVRYPSKKMGVTIQAESHTVEFPLILEMEWNPHVLEYYDQPPPIKLIYLHSDGRKLGLMHTPDYFVIRRDGIGWVESKSEKDLQQLAVKMPNRYVKEGFIWRCPPGECYATQYGFTYQLKSSAEFNETYLRNLLFLEDYLKDDDGLNDPGAGKVISRVSSDPGITLGELLAAGDGNDADRIYRAIALGDLYVDIHSVLLAEPERVQVFAN